MSKVQGQFFYLQIFTAMYSRSNVLFAEETKQCNCSFETNQSVHVFQETGDCFSFFNICSSCIEIRVKFLIAVSKGLSVKELTKIEYMITQVNFS